MKSSVVELFNQSRHLNLFFLQNRILCNLEYLREDSSKTFKLLADSL
jgi:hypothetical protein